MVRSARSPVADRTRGHVPRDTPSVNRIHVAIGPIVPRASWRWLGPHMAESLADTCTVRFFGARELPSCDVAIFVKERPAGPLSRARERGVRLLYMPVDFYTSRTQLDADAPFLGECAGLLVHSRVLARSLAPHNAAIWRVDHPNLHGLATRPPYRGDRTLLWIGDFLNLPFLLRWKERAGWPGELKILTNARRTTVRGMAMTLALARRLGVELDVGRDRINGIPMVDWDLATQRSMMAATSAAVDVKGGEEDFSQFTKPPTKAHQFVVSGIPYATNRESSSVLELREEGFEVADVDAGASFVVRRSVWLALKGYHPGATMGSPACGGLDLVHRVRHLGLDVEPAPAAGPPRPQRTRPIVRAGDEIVVCTAITNGYDRLRTLRASCASPARQVAFLDAATRSATMSAGNWEVRDVDLHDDDDPLRAKRPKFMPELYFPDAEYSLWIDGNVALIHPYDIRRLIDEFLGEADICVARHHARICLDQEARVCRRRRLDSELVIDRQTARYRREGFPAGYGLHELPVVLRRHTDAVRAFDRLWWQEMGDGSWRDQLSFDYVRWKTGVPVAEFPLPIQDNNGLFEKVAHARRRPLRQSRRPDVPAWIARMEGIHVGTRPPPGDP